jgi:hypothetical protein
MRWANGRSLDTVSSEAADCNANGESLRRVDMTQGVEHFSSGSEGALPMFDAGASQASQKGDFVLQESFSRIIQPEKRVRTRLPGDVMGAGAGQFSPGAPIYRLP